MCFGSSDNPAAAAAAQQTQLMEQQNAKHNQDVQTGAQKIGDAFSNFNDDYYNKYAQSYRDVYNPQLTDQYGIAKDKLTAMLAGNDQLGGSVGNNSMAQLEKTYANGQADIANKSTDAANGLRANV